MAGSPEFDVAAAHRYFAAHCCNEAWSLIEKAGRTVEDDRMMVAASHASLYHWLNRPDCSDQNRSIAHWQLSRIQSLLGNAAEAKRHADACLGYSHGLEPFYRGFAYEALARAAATAGDAAVAAECLALAQEQAAQVAEADERDMLLRDLAELK